MSDLLSDIKLLRDAASVQRYHTKRTIRNQCLGSHSFGVAMLVLSVWPDCRKELLVECLYHDMPELVTGDIPAPIKRADPELARRLAMQERCAGPLYVDCQLTEYEQDVLKWADTMELVLWCLEEYTLGNKFVLNTIRRGMGWILQRGVPLGCVTATEHVSAELRGLGIPYATGKELEEKI